MLTHVRTHTHAHAQFAWYGAPSWQVTLQETAHARSLKIDLDPQHARMSTYLSFVSLALISICLVVTGCDSSILTASFFVQLAENAGDNIFLQTLYQNVFARNPVYFLWIITGAGTMLGSYNPSDVVFDVMCLGNRHRKEFTPVVLSVVFLEQFAEGVRDNMWASANKGVQTCVPMFAISHFLCTLTNSV